MKTFSSTLVCLSLGLSAVTVFAQDAPKKDAMGKDAMSKDAMGKDEMKK